MGDDDELLDLLCTAGCRIIFLGLESIDKKNLKQLNKDFDPEEYQRQIKNMKKHKINVVGYFILGLDNDTSETFNDLYRFILKTGMIIPIINILIPVPGTKIFDDMKTQNRLYIENESDFCKENPLYSVPMNYPYFKPALLSESELSKGILELGKKLFTIKNVLLRSMTYNPIISFKIYQMNMELRKKYYAMSSL
jgi:radical SAM superfamily enzyme YgiQ (UPF0313 family)